MERKEIIQGLNNLLTKNYDAEKGYAECRKKIKTPVLSALFNQKAIQRYDFGHEIKDLISSLDGQPDKSTSVEGTLHRLWLDARVLMSNEKEEAILEEIERGEEKALEEYNQFLRTKDLPRNIRMVITHQRNQIARALDRIEILEDVYDN